MGLLRRLGVAELFDPLIGPQRFDLVSGFFEEDGEVEHSVRVAALSCPSEARLRAGPIALLVEQHTEIARGCAMTELIGSAVNRRCCGEIPLLLE